MSGYSLITASYQLRPCYVGQFYCYILNRANGVLCGTIKKQKHFGILASFFLIVKNTVIQKCLFQMNKRSTSLLSSAFSLSLKKVKQ